MRNRLFAIASALCAALAPLSGAAQVDFGSVFSKFKLEARADAEVLSSDRDDATAYGMRGRYFNLMVGGDLGEGFSYYFRQRLKAEPGSIKFFDNTDFMWLNYQLSDQWRVRLGKDAMAVGGYEYDAAPIDVYMESEYWNNFYCFQLGASVAYTTADGRQSFVAQVTQSPYIQTRGYEWNSGLLAYNFEWLGSIGQNVHTLFSTSMMQRDPGQKFVNLTVLGTQVAYGRWDSYLDLMHQVLDADEWGKVWGVVWRCNYRLSPRWTLFAKFSHEENRSLVQDYSLPGSWFNEVDGLVPTSRVYSKAGLGVEFHPKGMQNVRLHGYVAMLHEDNLDQPVGTADLNYLTCNLGFTWAVDVRNIFKK
ncbi:MAG: hypothetical protein IJ760_03755 [Bacteroidales bacterium]|nr:hypothetical protein [Bacteroidales bacterium]